MAFRPLEELQDPIVVRARGKEYTLPVIMWEQGVELQKRIANGLTPGELTEALLGKELFDQLAADGVPMEFVARCSAVALAEWKFGRETAKAVWEQPELMATLNEALGATPAVSAGGAPQDHASPRNPKKRKRNRSSGRKS